MNPASSDMRATMRAEGCTAVLMRHHGLGFVVSLRSDQPMTVERAPIETLNHPDHDAPDSTLQGVALLLRRRFEAGQTRLQWTMRLGAQATAKTG